MSLYHNAIFVSALDKMPPGECWLILEFGSVHIPGDLRSIQAPGHGYPERDETCINVRAFLNEADFTAAMSDDLQRRHWPVVGVHVTGERFKLVPTIERSVHGTPS